MTGATCYWCWHCLRVTEPTKFWRGDLFRCATCQGGTNRVPVEVLRRFSFLHREGETLEEMLRRSRSGEADRGASGTYSTDDARRHDDGRARYDERWDRQARHEEQRETPPPRPRHGRMTVVEAERVLGVTLDAGEAVIRAAFRRLALTHHPDRHATAEARGEAQAMMARINEAYRRLMPRGDS